MERVTNLVLSRRVGQSLDIDGPCTVKVVRVLGGNVRLAVQAAESVRVLRPDAKRKERAA